MLILTEGSAQCNPGPTGFAAVTEKPGPKCVYTHLKKLIYHQQQPALLQAFIQTILLMSNFTNVE